MRIDTPNRALGPRLVAAACVAFLAAPASRAQTADAFEVASIRRNVDSSLQGSGLAAPQPGGRYLARGATLRRLVADAHGPGDVLGGPDWVDTERFDVNARASGERTPAQIAGMLRTLLAERFNLAVHRETREVPVYVLAVARADRRLGPGLRESSPQCAEEARRYVPTITQGTAPPCGDFRLGAGSLVGRGMTMDGLASRLSGRVDRPVLDRTGLSAAYDLELEWSSDVGLRQAPPGSAGADDLRPGGVTLVTALQEQLGLRLVPARGPVEVIVIDRAEPPIPN